MLLLVSSPLLLTSLAQMTVTHLFYSPSQFFRSVFLHLAMCISFLLNVSHVSEFHMKHMKINNDLWNISTPHVILRDYADS